MICPTITKVASIINKDMRMTKNEDGSIKFSGIIGRYLSVIMKALAVSFEVVQPEDHEIGRLSPDGNWTGMIGMIQKGEADLAIHFMSISEQRSHVVDFSPVFKTDDVTFAIKKPGRYPTSLAFVHPFQCAIWLMILGSIVLIPLAFQILLRTKYAHSKILLVFLGSILKQSNVVNDESFIGRTLFGSWLVFATVVSSSYSAVLLALLTIPSEMPTVRNFKELSQAVEKSDYKCFIPKGTIIVDALINNKNEHLNFLYKAVLRNEWYLDLTVKTQIDSHSAIVSIRSGLERIAGPEEWKKYFLSDDTLTTFLFAMQMSKKFCHKIRFKKIMSRLNGAGIYMHIVKEEAFKMLLAAQERAHIVTLDERPLSSRDLIGAFLLLFIGLQSSVLALCCEIAWMRLQRSKGV